MRLTGPSRSLVVPRAHHNITRRGGRVGGVVVDDDTEVDDAGVDDTEVDDAGVDDTEVDDEVDDTEVDGTEVDGTEVDGTGWTTPRWTTRGVDGGPVEVPMPSRRSRCGRTGPRSGPARSCPRHTSGSPWPQRS